MADDSSTPDPNAPDFAVFITQAGKGKTHRELTAALQEVTKSVLQTLKPGKITLTLTFKPQKGVEGALLITDQVTTSIPRFDRPASIFYADDTGGLHRNDPRQPSLYDEVTQEARR
ncbi:hypothetical protein ABZ215_13750 [Amycolatopsis sp. NPDC006131]|uniref:hypothetical protein n=1 Tax=Amycolatopsis sp. NPDC006131 TaxID=3156731 RepID=UPI0033B73025